MSHGHIRTDKTCLNCGAHPIRRYCPDCGQENVEPKESVGHFIIHFFNDIIHFEGKFFTTMGLLLRKPGFVAKEYMEGKRAKYVNPIRLYLFMSFAFFLIAAIIPKTEPELTPQEVQERQEADSMRNALANGDSVKMQVMGLDGKVSESSVKMDTSVARYDSLQRALPADKRDNFIRRYTWRRTLGMMAYISKHPDTASDDVKSIIAHTAPKVFIISLPLFAFGLYLLYVRRRNTYYFVSHGVFAIHFYCVFFMAATVYYLVALAGSTISLIGSILLMLFLFVYLYKAMRRFYEQRAAKTILKLILMAGYTVIFGILLFIGTVINTVFTLGGHH